MVLRIGHRGASGEKKENTIEAFQRAVELKCDWIELDVRITDFDELVICHDETILDNNKTRKKREELSISATKSIKKEEVEIVVKFD